MSYLKHFLVVVVVFLYQLFVINNENKSTEHGGLMLLVILMTSILGLFFGVIGLIIIKQTKIKEFKFSLLYFFIISLVNYYILKHFMQIEFIYFNYITVYLVLEGIFFLVRRKFSESR